MPGTKFKQVKDKNPGTETYLAKVSKVESGNNPNAQNPYGSATGLFQFTSGTWEGLNKKYNLGYTLEDRKNPERAANMMRIFTQENENFLRPVLGRDLTDGERYLAHFMGAGGAKKFFTAYQANPNAPISAVLSSDALKANKGVVYNSNGSLKTLGDIYGWANNKMSVESKPLQYTQTSEKPESVEDYKAPYLPTSSVPLEASTAKYVEPETNTETAEVQQAKQEIKEKSFVQDLGDILSQPQEPQQPKQQQEFAFDPQAYDYIDFNPYDFESE